MAITYKFIRDWVFFGLKDLAEETSEYEVRAIMAEGIRELQAELDLPESVLVTDLTYPADNTGVSLPTNCAWVKAISLVEGENDTEKMLDKISRAGIKDRELFATRGDGYAYVSRTDAGGFKVMLSWEVNSEQTLKLYYFPYYDNESVSDLTTDIGADNADLIFSKFAKALREYTLYTSLEVHGRSEAHMIKAARLEKTYIKTVGRMQRWKHLFPRTIDPGRGDF